MHWGFVAWACDALVGLSQAMIVGASTLSALSGVGKGIKWLSNLNMGLGFFLLFGSMFFGVFWLSALGNGLFEYLIQLPKLLFTVWRPDGSETGDAMAGWQAGWSVFYWAWWIAFAAFVAMFLARVNRTSCL
jgi:choline-glycine betaine transporter